MITSSTAAGIGASAVLALVEVAFGDQLEGIEHAAAGVAAVGVGLTGYGIYHGGPAAEAAATYWTIAATAGIPAVLLWWARRRRRSERLVAAVGGAIAERNYRRVAPPTDDLPRP